MQTRQIHLRTPDGVAQALAPAQAMAPDLVIVFGSIAWFTNADFVDALATAFPRAHRVGCSTAGEITQAGVFDGSAVITAIRFERTTLREAVTDLDGMDDSQAAGERLARQLEAPDLRGILVLGPGVNINGSALLRGMTARLDRSLPITGGLAGDGGAFKQTFSLSSSGASDRQLVAIGFCGEHFRMAHGSYGGWQPFGPARKVTRCAGNVLYELDGESALAVYKRYLGEHAKDLPASGLLFPFLMASGPDVEKGLIRTILGVDEASGSLTLAGEIDGDGYLKLMHSSADRLVDGAHRAAEALQQMLDAAPPGVALLVSCVGRRLVMGDRCDEEVEAVTEVLGANATVAGYYSYGEVSPTGPGQDCKLHNQTMTISYLAEV
jgi:hypothetical protein